ncbi:DUF6621 family protein [Bacteroides fluxus]|jgi:hypothetical protein|uniref:L-selectin n=1 Tax=Bacteroides fluxus YIT 12057 TaxID=763034 RepID=F3PQV1_9BACE|nr:DUF6621 family protein [Bacteroides fluxus]EGF58709.1 hypothetical protein HMPREF9446_01099 [Bacteroides fluxus YIT 12057]MDY3790133.1 DUF6621 family protein [Bacteroides fluxus]
MNDEIKFPANVILIDVAFLNETVCSAKNFLENKLGRKLPDIDLPAWLSYLALDAGLREGENEVEVLLVHTQAGHVLRCCEPSDVDKLNHQACRTPLGEFAFSSVTSSGFVSTEELFLDLMNLALDSADVKCLMLLPFHQVYGSRVEEKLAGFFKDKSEEEKGKAVYFTLEEPMEPVHCRWEPVIYSLAHVLGIKSDEL